VAGTLAALDNDIGVLGTAPEINLWDGKVLHGESGTVSDVAEGILWAANNNAEVISMSLGSTEPHETIKDAVETTHTEGSLMVAAAGNTEEGPVVYPAAYEEVIAVSATDEDDNLAGFSAKDEEIEIAAPGVEINSTLPGDDYGYESGTSMAAPHVSGVSALIFQMKDIDASDDDPGAAEHIRQHLKNTAEDIGLDPDEQGSGLVDAGTAVEKYELSISVSGEGITVPAPGVYEYYHGEEAIAHAHPEDGWRFEYWTGDVFSTSSTITVEMYEDKSITANFYPEDFLPPPPISPETTASLELTEYEEYLEEGPLSGELLDAFKKEGIEDLGKEAELSRAEEGWWITVEGEKEYWVYEKEEELKVYAFEEA